MNRINVMIADDHSIIRQGIKEIIEHEEDIRVIAQASNGGEAVKLARECKPDVILMDINMPGIDGLQAIKELKSDKSNSSIKIVVLTIHEDKEYLFKTLKMGVDGYVLKDAEPNVLVDAIRSVYKGQTYIQPNMTKELVKEFTRVTTHEKKKESYKNLTNRELQILELITEGMINKEIAQRLYISEKTVKNHISNIFKKLNVSDRTQAAVYAIKNNIRSSNY